MSKRMSSRVLKALNAPNCYAITNPYYIDQLDKAHSYKPFSSLAWFRSPLRDKAITKYLAKTETWESKRKAFAYKYAITTYNFIYSLFYKLSKFLVKKEN